MKFSLVIFFSCLILIARSEPNPPNWPGSVIKKKAYQGKKKILYTNK